jgi:hypothetical protein
VIRVAAFRSLGKLGMVSDDVRGAISGSRVDIQKRKSECV